MYVSRFCLAIVFFASCFCLSFANPGEAFYRTGDRGPEVQEIQVRLKKLGYEIGTVDGVFGGNTAKAVKTFQTVTGIDVDGVVGEQTFRKLMERDMPPSRAGMVNTLRRLISSALSYQGVPYVFGGISPYGFDCSGYTKYVFAQAGIDLPRMADDQFYATREIAKSELSRGDLVYFTTYTPGISHVGIYLGNDQFISATSSAGIAIRSLYDSYWGPRYVAASRVI